MENLGKTIKYAFLGILALFALGFAFLLLPMGDDYEFLIVRSGSMEPAVPTGALVFIERQERYTVDDIITFRTAATEELPTTHRIIEENLVAGTISYITKGDANVSQDQIPVTQSDIIGRVMFSIPYVGYILDFARQPLGFVLLIVLPALLIMIEEASSLWKEWRKRPEEEVSSSAS